MQVSYQKGYSRELGREMERKRYGYAGRPVVVFPTSNGRFFQFEDLGAIAALGEFIDTGRIQVWTLDGIDGETFVDKGGDMRARMERHEAYFRHVRDEALPEMTEEAAASNGGRQLKPLFAGCSMGAFHASNFVFRFPELSAGVIALSGVYSTKDFFGEALDGAIFFNSPLNFLPGLSDTRVLNQLRELRLIFCCGQGDGKNACWRIRAHWSKCCATRRYRPGSTTGAVMSIMTGLGGTSSLPISWAAGWTTICSTGSRS